MADDLPKAEADPLNDMPLAAKVTSGFRDS